MDDIHLYVESLDEGWCTLCGDNGDYNHYQCSSCYEIRDLAFLPNPYNFDISGDSTSDWICEPCYQKAEADVRKELGHA